jgi:DNA polymerase-1
VPTPERPPRSAGPLPLDAVAVVRQELSHAGFDRQDALGLCITPGLVALAYGGRTWLVETTEPEVVVADLEQALAPRWVWWSSQETATGLVAAGVRPAACWDLGAVHRLVAGGWADDPARVWATAAGRPESDIPESGQLDLLSLDGAAHRVGPANRTDPDAPATRSGRTAICGRAAGHRPGSRAALGGPAAGPSSPSG